MPPRLAQRVLLIGWDACDWKIAQPLIDAGHMPTLKRLITSGVWGNLATIQPILSPVLWNSIATGKRPHKHGIFGFTEPRPDGQGIRLASSTSRKCLALWNILHKNNLSTNVVGWYASHPAELARGVTVTNQFEQPSGPDPADWPLPADCIHPASLRDELAPFRVHPSELGPQALLPFVPHAARATPAQLEKIHKLRTMLAQTVSIQAVATHLLEHHPADLTMVYFEGIDRFGHEFMDYHPPKLDRVDPADFDMFKDVMNGIYRFHDMMLESLLKLAGDDTAVILMSDHGYHSDHLRPDPTASPVAWHRPIGVLAMAGPGIKSDQRIYGATILDAAPTALHLLGLPHATDMDGRPWLEAFLKTSHPTTIPTWESPAGVDCDDGRHPPNHRDDPEASRQAILQLVALGYMQAIPDDQTAAADRCVIDNRTQEIASLIDAGLIQQAIPLLESLLSDPQVGEACRLQLAVCQLLSGQPQTARQLLEPLLTSQAPHPRVWIILASIALLENNHDLAEQHLAHARLHGGDSFDILFRTANLELSRNRPQLAVPLFTQALKIDPDSAIAHDGLAQALLAAEQPDTALDHALRAIELAHHLPRAHHHLGLILLALNEPHRALDAFNTCLSLHPGHLPTHQQLEALHLRLGNPTLALRHKSASATHGGEKTPSP